MDATCGKRMVLVELQKMGFNLGIHKVRTSMKRLKFVAKRPKQHCYASGGKASVIALNYLNWWFNPERLNPLCSGLIAYIRTNKVGCI